MNTAELLIAAREKIAKPEHWTQKSSARRLDGTQTIANDQQACAWCALGAIWCFEDVHSPAEYFLCKARGWTGWVFVADFNDNSETTHADILKLYDDAIALARAEA